MCYLDDLTVTASDPTSVTDSATEDLCVRFAGDSGDGVQVVGRQYTQETAISGNDLATFPDFPAEIRAPTGTLFGVSAFQIHFGARDIRTSGDAIDILVSFNPAALKTNLSDLRDGGLVIVDSNTFSKKNLSKAGYDVNPLEDSSLGNYRVQAIDITRLTKEAVSDIDVSNKEASRSRNFWALGLILWLTNRDRRATTEWLQSRFKNTPKVLAANLAALHAGHAWGDTAEMADEIPRIDVAPAKMAAGRYRSISGSDAICFGLLTGVRLAGLECVYCSYPITPASSMLHTLSRLEQYGVRTFQAEDEIAAVGAALGASYAGQVGVTASSGPGLALKMETIGLAIAVELPLVIINAQRGGPSTGLPTKTEQSDLFQAVVGRNADSPLAVVAPQSPSDCFDIMIEAVRIATTFMTPVIVLTDGYLANASEPWQLPDLDQFTPFPVKFREEPQNFAPFARDPQTLARDWVRPGSTGLAHRIGGIEREENTGNISYDPENHQRMTDLRRDRINRIATTIPEQQLDAGKPGDQVLVLGWGSSWGPIRSAVEKLRNEGMSVASTHLRHIWPMPANLEKLLNQHHTILVPEMNDGQLVKLLRAEFAIDAVGINKVSGQPFRIIELQEQISRHLKQVKSA